MTDKEGCISPYLAQPDAIITDGRGQKGQPHKTGPEDYALRTQIVGREIGE